MNGCPWCGCAGARNIGATSAAPRAVSPACWPHAGRYQELLDLIDTAPFLYWNYRRYGVRALAAQGRTDEAILLAAGRSDEAYRRYAVIANRAGTHLATYRAIKKKYPGKAPRDLLDDLIASTPDEPGRWFATAKGLGFLDLAADLARRSQVNIGTLLRSARDHLDQPPEFALAAATAALHWMAKDQFYELKAWEV
jgi:hypothetical protein